MAENQRPNPAFEKESIIMQHGIFALLVGTLNNQIQVKYQSIKASPFDSHDVTMSAFLLALFVYATASVAEVMLRARESPYSTLVGNLRLFASALAAILLLSILAPILGCVISAVWACLFLGIAYESSVELYSILNQSTSKLLDMLKSVRGRNAEPDQSNV
ncbi:RPB1A [Salix purpurea]|uniref:RPB1A n=1 Tax=Salix purpurea TaxID=77065 RepID=A0A9Q0P0R1_SALPP|nr:RPB1A [Salix purpurea]